MSKKEISIDQFRALIKEEAMKINKKALLESEKYKLQEELKECSYPEGYESEEMMDEAAIEELFGMKARKLERKREEMKKKFMQIAHIWKMKGSIRGMNQEMLDDLMAQAEADGFEGKPGLDKENQLISYRPANSINWGGLGITQGGAG